MKLPPPGRAFPTLPLFGAAALVAVTLAAAGLGARGGNPPSAASAQEIAARELRFEDQADGSVAIRDPRIADPIAVLAPGTNGFIRASLRGLARERRREEMGPETPFRLIAWDDGRLTLEDPATRRAVDLKAFGPTNAEAFARLLTAAGGPP